MGRRNQRVLAQAGTSLADVYDVEGSIVGVDELDSESVKTVHEMGGVIMSERYVGRIIQLTSGAIAQSIAFNINLTLGRHLERILHWAVTSDVTARTQSLQLSLADISTAGVISTDCPFWAWNTGSGDDIDKPIRLLLNGTVVNNRIFETRLGGFPTIASGSGQPGRPVNQLVFRGQSTAFGAGTVTLTALILVAAAQRTGPGSGGLPIPSW